LHARGPSRLLGGGPARRGVDGLRKAVLPLHGEVSGRARRRGSRQLVGDNNQMSVEIQEGVLPEMQAAGEIRVGAWTKQRCERGAGAADAALSAEGARPPRPRRSA